MFIPLAQPVMTCNTYRDVETVQMIRVIRHVLLEKGWWHLPRYVYGSSSGGCIALELAMRFPLQVCAYPLDNSKKHIMCICIVTATSMCQASRDASECAWLLL